MNGDAVVRSAVLIIEAESSGVELLQAAATMGLLPLVFDRRPLDEAPTPVRRAVESGRARYSILDTRDIDAVSAAAGGLAQEFDLTAVLPGVEYAVPAAAVTAALFGLPGIDPAVAVALRDKTKMKNALMAAGVAVARAKSLLVDASEAELVRAATEIGFPAVLKPADGSGSLGVRRIDDLDQLRGSVLAMRSSPIDDLGRSIGSNLLLESYLDGPEFSVEGYATPGEVVIVAVTQKQLGPEPHFVETGHIVDAELDAGVRHTLTDKAIAAVRALRLDCGVFHLEARLTSAGPVVIEVAARLAGDRIPRLVSLVYGCELPSIMIRCGAGWSVPRSLAPAASCVAGVRYFTVGRPSRLADDPLVLIKKLDSTAGAMEVVLDLPENGELTPPVDFRQRFGHIVVAIADRTSLDIALRRADDLVNNAVQEVAACAF